MQAAPSRFLAVAAAMVLLAAAHAHAHAQEAADRPVLRVGDRWVMARTDLWTGREIARTRTEVGAVDAGSVTVVHRTSSPAGDTAVQEVAALDPETFTFASASRTGSLVELAFPLVVGKKWTSEFRTPSPLPSYVIPHARTAQVEAWETVRVPAGSFQALRISYTDRLMLFIGDGIFPAYVNEKVWYAPAAKWPVRRETTVLNPLRKVETQTREELVEYRLAPP
jgi:hypothetical protein